MKPVPELARRIDRLFEVMHKRDTPPVSTAAAAAAITTNSGVPLTAVRVEALRSGEDEAVAAPTNAELTAIAAYFGVSPRYLTTAGPTPDIDAQLDLLLAMRDTGVHDIRACNPAHLTSPEAHRALADILRKSTATGATG